MKTTKWCSTARLWTKPLLKMLFLTLLINNTQLFQQPVIK